jgi:phosphohistidine phosphatase SixA
VSRRALLVVLLALLAPAGCGDDDGGGAAAAPTATATPSPLLAQLRAGGRVLVFRHAITEPKTDRVESVRTCATQRRLTAEGRAQARAIGRDVRALGIPIGEVRTSPFCRTRDTARLAFGRATLDPSLIELSAGGGGIEAFDRRARALRRAVRAVPDPPDANTVLVTHTPNLGEAAGLSLDEGEAAVFAPDGKGATKLVGRVQADGWRALRPPG